MNSINVVEQTEFKYDIEICTGIFNLDNHLIYNKCKGKRLLVIVSEVLKDNWHDAISAYFTTYFGYNAKIIYIDDNNSNKNINTILDICDTAFKNSMDRRSIMVAIGGGVLLDIVGFSASIYRRRINYIRIPTTLVGQIDAGIGIKTAVDFMGEKNFLGSFYPPYAVFNSLEFLDTLPNEAYVAGIAEILKVAIMLDRKFFTYIENNLEEIIKMRDKEMITYIENRAIELMLSELKGNFYEENLMRKVDFGHTFSPFIEHISNYKITHGIAVAYDMIWSAMFSFDKGILPQEDYNRIIEMMKRLKIKFPRGIDANTLVASLDNIVMHRGNAFNYVIPKEIGQGMFIFDKEECNSERMKKYIFESYKIFGYSDVDV